MNLKLVLRLCWATMLLLSMAYAYADYDCYAGVVTSREHVGHKEIKVNVFNYTGHKISIYLVADYFSDHHTQVWNWETSYDNADNSYWLGNQSGRDEGYDHALYQDLYSGQQVYLGASVPTCSSGRYFTGGAKGVLGFRVSGLDGTTLYFYIGDNHYGAQPNDVKLNYADHVVIARAPKPDNDRHYASCPAGQTQAGPLCVQLLESSSGGGGGYNSTAVFNIYLNSQANQGLRTTTLDGFRTKFD